MRVPQYLKSALFGNSSLVSHMGFMYKSVSFITVVTHVSET